MLYEYLRKVAASAGAERIEFLMTSASPKQCIDSSDPTDYEYTNGDEAFAIALEGKEYSIPTDPDITRKLCQDIGADYSTITVHYPYNEWD
jgi:hypothetical protein